MKYFLGLALAVWPALGQTGAVAPIALFTQFQPQPSPVVFDSMRREVGNIMAPLGFPLQWWSLDEHPGFGAATELAVITFRGNCNPAYLFSTGSTDGPLGFTNLTDGLVLPFAEVNCDRIRDFLKDDLTHMKLKEREEVFGRAVGRVVAHELFHVFVGTRKHGSSGVAEPAFTQRDLLSDHFRLDPREFRLLRASLKPARAQNSRLRSGASPVAGRYIFEESGCATCHGPMGNGTASAPALRGALNNAKAFAATLAHSFRKMSIQAKAKRIGGPPLDADEVADVFSFLNESGN